MARGSVERGWMCFGGGQWVAMLRKRVRGKGREGGRYREGSNGCC